METRLTTKEVAELENKNERTIRRWAKDEIIKAECTYNEFNSPAYLIPVSELTDGAQKKYFAQVKARLPKAAISASKKDHPLDCMVFLKQLQAKQLYGYVPCFRFSSVINAPNKFMGQMITFKIFLHQDKCVKCNAIKLSQRHSRQ